MQQLHRIIIAILVIMLIAAPVVTGAIYYVNGSGGSNSNNGQSWTAPFATLQKALDVAAAGDTIWIAKGRYVPTEDRNGSTSSSRSRYRTFMLKDKVRIYGGFAGNEPANYDTRLRDFTANETILSGDLNGNDGSNFSNNSENAYNVVAATSASPVSQETILDGLTISGGNADASGSPGSNGGGLRIESSNNPTLVNVIFRDNTAPSGRGGAVDIQSAGARFINTQFINNGSALRIIGSSSGASPYVSLANVVFQGNSGTNIGAIRTDRAVDLILTNVTMYNNARNGAGAAIYVQTTSGRSARVEIRNSVIYENKDMSSNPSAFSGSMAVIRNTFVDGTWYDASGNTSTMGAPLFVNPATGDFRLQATSPLLNMGDPLYFNAGQTHDLSGINTDVTGHPRIVGGQIDPGAYQNYISCSGTPTAGVLTSSVDSVCPREITMLTLSGSSTDVGVRYLWQQRVPASSGVWTDIVMGLDTLLNIPGQTTTTDYRCLVICSNTADTAYSNEVTVKSYPCIPRWYVNGAGGSDNNTGHSWTQAFATVQRALTASWPGDTIWVAKGKYLPSQDRSGDATPARSRSRTFLLKDSVQLYGGFAGNEPPDYDIRLRDFTANETILSGDLNGNDGSGYSNYSDNAYNVVSAASSSPVSAATILSGFTISGGNADASSSPGSHGGGLRIEGNNNPTLVDVIFRDNTAPSGRGGAVNIVNGHAHFINTQFINNASALRIEGNTSGTAPYVLLTNVVFRGNSGTNIGAIRTDKAVTLILTNVTIYNNSRNGGGAAVYIQTTSGHGAHVEIRNSIIHENTDLSGAQSTFAGSMALIRNTFVDGTWYDGSGNTSTMGAPLFVNAVAGDLRQQAGSPVRARGNPGVFGAGQTPDLSAITTDLDGRPRIVGSQIDPGPYQSDYPICAGTPLPGTIAATVDSICVRETFTLTLSGATRGLAGISYLWQKRVPSGSGVWADVFQGADTVMNITGQSVTTDYRCLVICSNSSDTSYSNEITVKGYACIPRWYVNASGGDDNSNGHSWQQAFATVQRALDVSWPGDTVWIARGKYLPSQDRAGNTTPGRSRYRTFLLKDSIQLYGGFAGNEPPDYDISLRDFTTNETILSGDLNGNDGPGFSNYSENMYNVVTAASSAPVSAATVLNGVTISGGNADASGSPGDRGGGMRIEPDCNPTLIHVIIRDNTAPAGRGGGINIASGSASFSHTQFINNAGALRIEGGSTVTPRVLLTNVVFRENSGTNIGAIRTDKSVDLILTNVTMYNNARDGSGASIYNQTSSGLSAHVEIRNSIIYGNTTLSGGQSGFSGSMALIRNTLVDGTWYDGSGNTSPAADPLFINAAAGDLRLQRGCPLRGDGNPVVFAPGQTPDLSAVTTDIAGSPRIVSGLTDPGAWQAVYLPLDAITASFLEPEDGDTLCAGNYDTVKVTVSNYGNEPISGMPVILDYSFGTAGAILTGPLPPGHTDTMVFSGVYMMTSGAHPVRAYTALGGDADRTNDSLATTWVIRDRNLVLLGNDTAFCDRNVLTLDVGNRASISWSTGATTTAINVTNSGIYDVVVTDNAGCTERDTISVTVHSLPSAVVTPSGSITLCQGDSIILDAGVQPGVVYVWKKDGTQTGTGTTYAASASGQYHVVATDGNSCSDSSGIIAVEVLPVPVIDITPLDAGFCKGGNILLEAMSPDTAGLTWQWLDAAGIIRGANASFYQVDIPGSYQLIVNRANTTGIACADSSAVAVIVEWPLPEPEIYWNGVVLRTDSMYASYQWYCNSQLLPFATSSAYTPVQQGGFNVVVTDTNGCTNASDPVYVQPGRAGYLQHNIAVIIYPNPAASMLIIESPVPAHVTISSMDGKTVLQTAAGEPGRIVVDVSALATGVYQIRVTGEDGLLIGIEKLFKI